MLFIMKPSLFTRIRYTGMVLWNRWGSRIKYSPPLKSTGEGQSCLNLNKNCFDRNQLNRPRRRCGEILFATLLWMEGCLENGGLHTERPFEIKRTTLDGWKGSFKMAASIESRHLQLKEQLWLAETVGHFKGTLGRFCRLSQMKDTSKTAMNEN